MQSLSVSTRRQWLLCGAAGALGAGIWLLPPQLTPLFLTKQMKFRISVLTVAVSAYGLSASLAPSPKVIIPKEINWEHLNQLPRERQLPPLPSPLPDQYQLVRAYL